VSHALEALRLLNLGFRPIVERPNSKLPLEPAWQKLTERGPEELREAFERAPEGHGVGTITHGFIVIDLDVRPDGKNGLEALRELEARVGWPLPGTLTSLTPSGGRHLFYRIPAGVEIKNSVSKLGPGIDVRGTGGQVVLPPTTIDGRPYRWDAAAPETMADLPASWLDLLNPPVVKPQTVQEVASNLRPLRIVRTASDMAHEADRRARYMATLDEPSIQGSNGNAVMMRAAFHAKEMSRNSGEALEALLEWNERCAQPAWSEDELLRAIRNSEAVFGAGLDRERPEDSTTAGGASGSGTARSGARHRVNASSSDTPQESSTDPAAADVAWVESMQAYVTRDRDTGVWNLTNPLTEKGAQMALVARGIRASAAKTLLKNCQVTLALRVDCDPSQPPTFRVNGQTVLNNYIPPTIKPAAGEFPVLDEVLTFLTAGDPEARRWLVNWLAFALQNPARPMRTVPVIYGAQRTGKSLITRAIMTLIGEENCATVRNEDIKGRFTSHFVTKLFVAVGEIEAGEVNHATSTLKYLTGEPQLVFEAKGSAAFHVQNRIKMIATSNQTLPVALEGEADTRWVLLRQLTPPSREYTARMDSLFDQSTNDWSEKGRAELAALAAYLLAYPVDAQLARSVHANEARAAAVEASRSSVEQFVDAVKSSSLDAVWLAHVPEYERTSTPFDHMDIPGHEHLTGVTAVYATYRAFCKASGLQPLGTGRFPGELERYAPTWQRHKVAGSIVPTRPWAYTGLPRERRIRLQYLPMAMRQPSLLSPAEAPKRDADEVRQRALAVMQQTFGPAVIEEDHDAQ
jgi:phage/plasmid-associated DNA primase